MRVACVCDFVVVMIYAEFLFLINYLLKFCLSTATHALLTWITIIKTALLFNLIAR